MTTFIVGVQTHLNYFYVPFPISTYCSYSLMGSIWTERTCGYLSRDTKRAGTKATGNAWQFHYQHKDFRHLWNCADACDLTQSYAACPPEADVWLNRLGEVLAPLDKFSPRLGPAWWEVFSAEGEEERAAPTVQVFVALFMSTFPLSEGHILAYLFLNFQQNHCYLKNDMEEEKTLPLISHLCLFFPFFPFLLSLSFLSFLFLFLPFTMLTHFSA